MAVLLGTIRPTGVLGDAVDATTLEGSRVAGTFQVPTTPLALGDLAESGTVEFLRFFYRVGWYSSGFGPNNPQAWAQWRVGAGSYESSEAQLPPEGVGVLQTFQSTDRPTNPSGGAWAWADVNALQMRTAWFADDGFSGETTFGVVADIWAEVWGALPPADLPKIRAAGVVNVIRGSGILTEKRSGSGVVANVRGAGALAEKIRVASVVASVRGSGIVRVGG